MRNTSGRGLFLRDFFCSATGLDVDFRLCYTVDAVKPYDIKDDAWIRNNFEKLVDNHAGEYVAVAGGKVVFGKTRQDVEEELQGKIKKDVLPSVMQVPHRESLTCAL